jgi:hypothetical protein
MEKCSCKNRKRHPMLMAEVCTDCGRKHYRLEAEAGRYFADVGNTDNIASSLMRDELV